jgi:uncharacterized protein
MSSGTFIRNVYDAFARGDAASVLGALDASVRWTEADNFPYADRNPYIGPQQVGEGVFGRLMSEWDGFTIHIESIVDGGDTVVALGRYRATHKASGQPIDAQFAHAWTVRDGKIVRFQQYTDTLQFARVTGAVAV